MSNRIFSVIVVVLGVLWLAFGSMAYVQYAGLMALGGPASQRLLSPAFLVAVLASAIVIGGLLQRKPWAWISALLLAVVILLHRARMGYLYGAQVNSTFFMAVPAATIGILMLGSVRAQIVTNAWKKMFFAAAAATAFFLLPLAVDATALARTRLDDGGFRVVGADYRDAVRAGDGRTQTFLNLSLRMPEGFAVMSVARGRGASPWSVSFYRPGPGDTGAHIVLSDRALADSVLVPAADALGFRSAYDLEKRIWYPGASPLYRDLRRHRLQEGMEHARTLDVLARDWRGFVKVYRGVSCPDGLYDCTVFDVRSPSSLDIAIYNGGTFIDSDLRDLFASLRFEPRQAAPEFSEQGRRALDGKRYDEAIAGFLNALYFDAKNAGNAYGLASAFARARCADPRLRAGRLASAHEFARYALELDPRHAGAQRLSAELERQLPRHDCADRAH